MKNIAERVKVCPTCKHFIFKDDTVDFCINCCFSILPDIPERDTETDSEIEIIEKPTTPPPKNIINYILDIFW